MKVVDIADDIFRELGEPSSLSIPAITFWVRSNVGRLNNAINTEFAVDEESLEIKRKIDLKPTNIGIDEVTILKKMYSVYFYDTQIRANIKGLETDAVVEVSSDGMRVRKTSKTEIIRYLTSLKRLELEELNKRPRTRDFRDGGQRFAGDLFGFEVIRENQTYTPLIPRDGGGYPTRGEPISGQELLDQRAKEISKVEQEILQLQNNIQILRSGTE